MIEHWSEGVADFNMAEEILVELGETIRRHPWWQARTAAHAGTSENPASGPAGTCPGRRLRLGGHARRTRETGSSGHRHGRLTTRSRAA